MMACIKCANWLPTQRFDLQCRLRLLWTNASLHLQPFYARRKPPARSAAALSKKARSSSLVWEARAKAQRIVTSSSSVRVGAAVLPKSGYQRFWKACGGVSQLRCKSLRTLRGLLCSIAECSGPHLWAQGGRLGTFYRKERERRSPTEHTGCGIQQRHFRPRGQLASTLARVPYGSRPDESVYVSRLLICHTSATPRFFGQAYSSRQHRPPCADGIGHWRHGHDAHLKSVGQAIGRACQSRYDARILSARKTPSLGTRCFTESHSSQAQR